MTWAMCSFRPAPSQRAYLCTAEMGLFAIAEIEAPLRNSDVPLDANGLHHDRMLRILIGIRDKVSLPPINIEHANPGQRPYRVRAGVHRYYASLAFGFSHIPAEIVDRLD